MSKIEKITTEFAEYICDNLCKHPGNVSDTGITQDELEEICAECEMGKFVCDILNNSNNADEPKKVIEYDKTNRADCPSCGATVRGISKKYGDWCSHCGQKLEW